MNTSKYSKNLLKPLYVTCYISTLLPLTIHESYIFIFFSCTLLVFNSLAIGDLRKAMELVEEQQASAVGREIQAVQVRLL
jgi:hypothetical protein